MAQHEGVAQFYTTESLGETRSLTPEGFLLCQNVPLARTGTLLYLPEELIDSSGEPILEPGPDGIVAIQRTPEEVFSPTAISSFAGKPVTVEHPEEVVDPKNWKTHSVGVVLNPRRGDGRRFDDQYLYGDLLIQDAETIADVLKNKKKEVSAGYDASYKQLGPGRGAQFNIIGNHVALVDRGRCGPRCAIGDHAMPAAVRRLAKTSFRDQLKSRILARVRAGDEDGLVEELDRIPEMMGKVLSGDDAMFNPEQTNGWGEGGGEAGAPSPVTVHVHNNGTPAAPERPAVMPVPGTPPAKDAVDPAAAAVETAVPGAGPAPTPAAVDPVALILQRLDTLEQAVAALAAGGDEPDGDEDEDGDGIPDDEDPDDDAATGDAAAPDETEEDRKDRAKNFNDKKGRTGDAKRARVGDSTSLQSAFMEMVRLGAILDPDTKTQPTFDAAIGARITVERMCKFRRAKLEKAYTGDAKPIIDGLLAGSKPDFKQMTCDTATALFNGAATILGSQNNGRIGNSRPASTRTFHSSAPTPAEINAKNREKFGYAARG